jgi:nucleotide-binding universal stress UspA family protein
MRVVLSADGTGEGQAASHWCATHLGADDSVIAVLGINQLGEFVMGVPPFDEMAVMPDLMAKVQRECCDPVAAAGVRCETRVVSHGQARALSDVARRVHADLIVIGKRPHGALVDAVLGEVAGQLVHHPPCPVVVVPAG